MDKKGKVNESRGAAKQALLRRQAEMRQALAGDAEALKQVLRGEVEVESGRRLLEYVVKTKPPQG